MSTTFNTMTRCKDKVALLLNTYQHLRDDDNRLIATYWLKELGSWQVDTCTGRDFLKLFAEGKVTSPESIRRMRQKLQEEHPELRGKTYKQRHNMQSEIRSNINKS